MTLTPVIKPSSASPSRAWYAASISEFLQSRPDTVLGQLTKSSDTPILKTQTNAWLGQFTILQNTLDGLTGSVFLEFNIPRMGRRVDVILLIGAVVFVIEFKVGGTHFDQAAGDQVWDYALDLKNFHEASHKVSIVPILVATEAPSFVSRPLEADNDKVFRPVETNVEGLRAILDDATQRIPGAEINAEIWFHAPYHPTPTIVEAARSLYAQHSVEAITRNDAGHENLAVTSKRIEQLVESARETGRKIICFVTGVPGAGKTLVGLNIATHRRDANAPTHAVFLSGNGPLVAVLREALTRDEVARRKQNGDKVRKSKVHESVKAFIQNVHHFRDDGLTDPRPPIEHVVIFDEAQRAWDSKQTESFMRRKKNRPGFSQSEPEFLISCMDRHADWAVVVCLVGSGQEINIGEAGISGWINAIATSFPEWDTYVSSRLVDSEFAAAQAVDQIRHRERTHFDDCLHLAVSMRSFRVENVSAFVKALLDCEAQQARKAFEMIAERYPIAVTRNLNLAKDWVRRHARGNERFGMVSSSKAQRLKPYAIDIRVDVDPVHWFLNDKSDTRSSFYLEDAATEFQVQGLELDWACVTWDGDFRFTGSNWSFHDFRGDRWCNINNPENRVYLRNAYRVLLTRARQGMVIFVPPGEPTDATRSPAFYDPTFRYLTELGIPELR